MAISISEILNNTRNVLDMINTNHQDSSTTMPAISLSSPYIDVVAFDLYSNDPRGPPKFIEHYIMKTEDRSESFACTAYLTIEFSQSYEPLQLKVIDEISATSRRSDWLDEFGVSDQDVRNKALEGLFKELQRRKRELILNELEEIACREQMERKERWRRRGRCNDSNRWVRQDWIL